MPQNRPMLSLSINRVENGFLVSPRMNECSRAFEDVFVFESADTLMAWMKGWALGVSSPQPEAIAGAPGTCGH